MAKPTPEDCLIRLKEIYAEAGVDEKTLQANLDEARKLVVKNKGDFEALTKDLTEYLNGQQLRREAKRAQAINNSVKFAQNSKQIKESVRPIAALTDLVRSALTEQRVASESILQLTVGKLDAAGLLKVAEKLEDWRPVARQLEHFDATGKIEKIPGVNQEEFEIAKIWKDSYSLMYDKKINEGGYVLQKRKGYMGVQSLDPDLVYEAGITKFSALMREHLDPMFFAGRTEKQINTALKELFDDVVTRRTELAAIQGEKGLIKALNPTEGFEISRDLKYKNVDSWWAVHNELSKTHPLQNLKDEALHAGREIGLAKVFGTNHKAFVKDLNEIAHVEAANRKAGGVDSIEITSFLFDKENGKLISSSKEKYVDPRTNFMGGKPFLFSVENLNKYDLSTALNPSHLYVMLNGEGTRRATGLVASSVYNTMGFISALKTKAALFRNAQDVFNASLVHFSQFGGNFFNTFGRQVRETLGLLAPEQQKEFARAFMIGSGELYAGMVSNISFQGLQPGVGTRFSRMVHGLSGATFTQNAIRSSMIKNVAADLFQMANHSFGDLERVGFNMGQFAGITEREWEVIRAAKDVIPTMFGAEFGVLSPRAILDMKPEVLEPIASKFGIKPEKLRNEAFTKYTGYLDLLGRRGVISSSPEAAALVQRGKINSIWGMVSALFQQLKGYSLSSLNTLDLIARSNPKMQVQHSMEYFMSMPGAATMISMHVGGMATYAIGDAAYQMVLGRNPPDFTNKDVAEDYLIRSSPTGLFADIAFGKHFARDPLKWGEGPTLEFMSKTLGGALQTGRSAVGAVTGSEKFTAKPLLKPIVEQSAPIWWADAAMNYLFLNEVRNAVDPGINKRIKKNIESIDRVQLPLSENKKFLFNVGDPTKSAWR